jgi:hypothetical protein
VSLCIYLCLSSGRDVLCDGSAKVRVVTPLLLLLLLIGFHLVSATCFVCALERVGERELRAAGVGLRRGRASPTRTCRCKTICRAIIFGLFNTSLAACIPSAVLVWPRPPELVHAHAGVGSTIECVSNADALCACVGANTPLTVHACLSACACGSGVRDDERAVAWIHWVPRRQRAAAQPAPQAACIADPLPDHGTRQVCTHTSTHTAREPSSSPTARRVALSHAPYGSS